MRRRIGSPLYVRASSTHSAMATRAGVAECSTSDMAQRSSARSIRASPVTGYCGARRVISASIESRCAISAATSSRASAAAFGSRSSSARWRSRTASAVRWPKSASKTAASASRRPVRRPRTRSAPDAIDQHGHRPELETEQSFDGRGDRRADLGRERCEGLSRAGHEPQPDEDPLVADADRDRRPAEPAAPRRTATSDPDDARDLEGGESDELGDDAPADRQLRVRSRWLLGRVGGEDGDRASGRRLGGRLRR